MQHERKDGATARLAEQGGRNRCRPAGDPRVIDEQDRATGRDGTVAYAEGTEHSRRPRP